MKLPIAKVVIKKNTSDKPMNDLLAVEEPLEIRLEYGPAGDRTAIQLAITMRTPGQDLELTLGFLFTEGIIDRFDQVESIHYCETVKSENEKGNVVRAILRENVRLDPKLLQRHFYTTSSCGVCGKTSLEAVSTGCVRIESELKVSVEQIVRAPDELREAQKVFEYTGGLHAAGLFSPAGQPIIVREDIGRHNAVDKLIGAGLEAGLSFQKYFIVVSGRAGFELVQKTVKAGIPVMVAVGAPSSLAVGLAKNMGLTLVGFVRNHTFNIYTGKHRIHEMNAKS